MLHFNTILPRRLTHNLIAHLSIFIQTPVVESNVEEVTEALANLTADTSKKTTADNITSVANIMQNIVDVGSASQEVMFQEKACLKKNPNVLNLPNNK